MFFLQVQNNASKVEGGDWNDQGNTATFILLESIGRIRCRPMLKEADPHRWEVIIYRGRMAKITTSGGGGWHNIGKTATTRAESTLQPKASYFGNFMPMRLQLFLVLIAKFICIGSS